MLTVAVEDAIEVYNTFGLTEEETNKIDVLITKFERISRSTGERLHSRLIREHNEPLSLYKQLTKEKVQRSTTKLISYSGHKMQTISKNTLLIEYKDKFYPAKFQVTAQEEVMPVLGLPTCLDMALVKRIYAVLK